MGGGGNSFQLVASNQGGFLAFFLLTSLFEWKETKELDTERADTRTLYFLAAGGSLHRRSSIWPSFVNPTSRYVDG